MNQHHSHTNEEDEFIFTHLSPNCLFHELYSNPKQTKDMLNASFSGQRNTSMAYVLSAGDQSEPISKNDRALFTKVV
jgi:hypothetical protein